MKRTSRNKEMTSGPVRKSARLSSQQPNVSTISLLSEDDLLRANENATVPRPMVPVSDSPDVATGKAVVKQEPLEGGASDQPLEALHKVKTEVADESVDQNTASEGLADLTSKPPNKNFVHPTTARQRETRRSPSCPMAETSTKTYAQVTNPSTTNGMETTPIMSFGQETPANMFLVQEGFDATTRFQLAPPLQLAMAKFTQDLQPSPGLESRQPPSGCTSGHNNLSAYSLDAVRSSKTEESHKSTDDQNAASEGLIELTRTKPTTSFGQASANYNLRSSTSSASNEPLPLASGSQKIQESSCSKKFPRRYQGDVKPGSVLPKEKPKVKRDPPLSGWAWSSDSGSSDSDNPVDVVSRKPRTNHKNRKPQAMRELRIRHSDEALESRPSQHRPKRKTREPQVRTELRNPDHSLESGPSQRAQKRKNNPAQIRTVIRIRNSDSSIETGRTLRKCKACGKPGHRNMLNNDLKFSITDQLSKWGILPNSSQN